MRQRLLHLSLLLVAMLAGVPLQAWADREVNQPQFGKQTVTVASDETITFYDPWGTENIVDNNSYNSQSLTVFKPAEEGMSVQITFETLDLSQYGTSYYLYINLYDGVADADDAFAFATTTSGITSSSSLSAMAGTVIAEKVNNDNKPSLPATYTSGTADGALSVGFMHRNSNRCEGWVAKVKCVRLENQTVTGAGSNYEGVVASPTSKQNVVLANAYVTATGVMNPDNVTGIHFTLTQNEGVVDPTALKLFKGDKQVAATVAAEGTGYRFVLNEAPTEGTTTFTIKGDILGTAEVGAKVQVDIDKITTAAHADGISPFTAGTSVTIENPALVLMSAEPQTITVGETKLLFFDEGGKDGSIYSKTNGQVTFVPGVEGKKVMVNFITNNIWHGSLYNQELRIYNGREAKKENLIQTLQKGEAAIVRSTAEDGSLTVVLFSDASNEVSADGWEAEVSLFVPQPMDFEALQATQYSEGTVCAGDQNQRILDIVVLAQDTEPAMQVTKMNFTTNGTSDIVTKATLFCTGTSKTFSALDTDKVGEAEITADAFEITLTNPAVMAEGNNYFWLCYDISEDAQNGQTVDAALVSVTANVNGAPKTETASNGNPEGSRTVENTILSHANQGSVTKYVNGELAFNTQTASTYSSNCEAGTDDRINIFIPKHEGMVAQIDFSEFNVQYASTSYGNKSTFKIYAGQGTSGTLLWELDDHSQESTGPGKTIRSTSADGALTIVFNPKSSYSYAYKGWKATVSEYEQKAMTLKGIEVTQASTDIVSIGSQKQALIGLNIQTEGALDALSLSSLTLDLKGTQGCIDKVYIYNVGDKDGEPAAEAEAIGEAATNEASELTVSLATPLTLAEGSNYLRVLVDVNAEAEADQTIDAAVKSAKIGDTDVAVANGDPEGARTLKLVYLLQSGDNGEMVITPGRPIMFYDDGGADGQTSTNFTGTVTFVPKSPADAIKLDFQFWDVNYPTKFNLYHKGDAEGDYDAQYSMYDHPDQQLITSKSADGKITIKFTTQNYACNGFAIEVSAYTKEAVHVANVIAEDISTNEVLKGQTETKMLRIAVEAAGELNSMEITGFNFAEAENAAVAAQHIYTTGTLANFSANDEFSGNYTISSPGTYYFWLTYDMKADAEVGQTATAQLASIVVDGNTFEVSNPVSATVTIASGKSGTYTVGGENPDYTTIQGAIDDLGTLGMEGPVVLNIRAGEYNERVRVPAIKGMGAANTLTIQSESGERDVKIYHNNYTNSGYSDDQYSKVYGVVTFYEANYVTLKGVEVTTTDLSYDAVVMVKNESRHITIDDCYLHAATTTSTQQDINLVGHYAISEANKNNDYLSVRNSLLEGGYIGVSMGGTSTVALPKEVGGIVEGNTFKNQGSKAIYLYDELGAKVRNNTVIVTSDAEVNMTLGVLDLTLRDEYTESTEITGNIFNIAASKYTTGMYLRQLAGTAEAPVIIANNVVNVASLNASYGGIKLSDAAARNVNIVHNTVRLTGTNGGAAFWMLKAITGENILVANNIIQNETSGYAVNLFNDNNFDKVTFRNNVLHTAGETFYRASSGTTGNFDSFVEKTGATGCIDKQVNFLSDDVLEPADNLDGDLLKALPLTYVTTDLNGKERPAENISIGAYEYDPNALSAPEMAESYPKVTAALDGKASFSVKTDMAATVYWLVRKSSEEAPTAEELKASATKTTLTANTEMSVSMEGLEDNAEYKAYFLPVSLRNVEGSISATDAFIMAVTPPETLKPEADVYINNSQTEETVAAGSTVTLIAMVSVDEHTAPYTLTWMDSKHQVLLSETFDEVPEDLFMVTATPTECTDYTFLVTDAAGKADTATVRAIVTGEAVTATFENLYVDPEDGFWMGDFSKGLAGGSFVSGSYRFDNYACNTWAGQPTTPFWGNFGYANSTSNLYDGTDYMTQQWNNAVGGGYDGSENYLVAYPQGGKISVMNKADGDELRGFYITNDAWNVYAYTKGDGYTTEPAKEFTTGDYCKVTIVADNGKSLDYYLADYRSENTEDHYYLDTWQWVDLRPLGTVRYLTFSVTASRRNTYGTTTPQFFCIDNFNGTRTEQAAAPQTVEATADIALASLFALDASGTATYALPDGTPEGIKATVTLDAATGKLTVTGAEPEEFEITVSVTQKGKTQYLRIPFTIDDTTGLRGLQADDEDVEARYGINGQRLNTRQRGVNIVRMKNGSTRKVANP